MKKHIVTVRDTAGNVEENASVYVYMANTTTEAVLYSDNGSTVIDNPVLTNAKGQAWFYAADGIYDLYITGANITSYTLEDITIYEPVGVTATQTLINKTLITPSITFSSSSKTSGYSPTVSDFTLHCDDSGGSFTISLPPAASHKGRIFTIGKSNNSENIVTIDTYGSETIGLVPEIYLYLRNDYIIIQSDGTNWTTLGKTWDEVIYLLAKTGAISVDTDISLLSGVFTFLLGRIINVYGYVKTAPTGQDMILDININGTTIWTTQSNRLTIKNGTKAASQNTFNTTLLSQDDKITLDCDQVGSGVAGSNLTVLINARIQGRYLS